MEATKTKTPPPNQQRRRHRFLFTVGALFLILLGIFIGQVAVSVRRIKSGDLAKYQTLSSFTKSGETASSVARVDRPQVEAEDNPSLGPADAPLTIVEFGDFDCPFTQSSLLAVKQMLQEFPDKVRLIFRNFPIPSLHSNAEHVAEAAMCANDQHKFWEYFDLLLLSPELRTDDDLMTFAEHLGMDTVAFRSCLANSANAAIIQQDMSAGLNAGVEGTPTWFFNGYRIAGALSVENFRAVVQLGVAGKLK